MQNSVITECKFSEPSDKLTGDFGNCVEANLRSSERESSDPIQHKYNSTQRYVPVVLHADHRLPLLLYFVVEF
jgi:hypothetical protein